MASSSSITAAGSNALKCKLKVPAIRINEFPNEHLIVSFGKLYCSVCQETLAVKKSTVLNNVKSSKAPCEQRQIKV